MSNNVENQQIETDCSGVEPTTVDIVNQKNGKNINSKNSNNDNLKNLNDMNQKNTKIENSKKIVKSKCEQVENNRNCVMTTDAMVVCGIKTKRIKGHIIAKVVFCLVFAAIAICFSLISLKGAQWSEKIVRNVTFVWVGIFGRISAAIPFSVFELSCFLLIILFLSLIVAMIVFMSKRKSLKAFNHLCTIAVVTLGIFAMYSATTSVAYGREPLDIPFADNAIITNDSVKNFAVNYYKDYYDNIQTIQKDYVNKKGESKCPYTFEELTEKIRAEYQKLPKGYFPNYIPTAKKMISSWFMSQFSILGVTFTPYGEANINKDAPMDEVAHTIAHELAHTLGVMREYDANNLASYVLLNSSDPYLKYVGFGSTNAANNLIDYSNNSKFGIAEKNKYNKIKVTVVEKDKLRSIKFWRQNNKFEKIGSFFNDIYLKMQGQGDGVNSYYKPSQGEVVTMPDGEKVYSNIVYSDACRMMFALYD
ncbi:MAG: DUF3810 family protein [Clostridia bacterium]